MEKSLSKLLDPAFGSYAHCGTVLNIEELLYSSYGWPMCLSFSSAALTLAEFEFIIGSPSSVSCVAVLVLIADVADLFEDPYPTNSPLFNLPE